MARFPGNEIISLVGAAPRFDLAESVGPDMLAAQLIGASDASLAELPLNYGTAAGNPRLRAEIAALHGVGAEDVVITVGGMHALFLLAFILCDPGDHAVTTSPLFPLARNALDAVGANVSTLPLQFDRGYRLDVAQLSSHLSAQTKLVSLASPQNPSGVALSSETLRGVLAAIEEKCPEAYLLVDETYREAAYGENEIMPSAVGLGPRVVSIASLSKCHGAPGLRLGWAITRDQALRTQLVVGKFNTVVSCPALEEALALKLLGQRESILRERRWHLAEGLRRTAEWVAQNSDFVEWVKPDAGALCCLRLRRSRFDDAGVARLRGALAENDVRVGEGVWFGEEPRVFRLGFGRLPIAELERALAALAVSLEQAARAAA